MNVRFVFKKGILFTGEDIERYCGLTSRRHPILAASASINVPSNGQWQIVLKLLSYYLNINLKNVVVGLANMNSIYHPPTSPDFYIVWFSGILGANKFRNPIKYRAFCVPQSLIEHIHNESVISLYLSQYCSCRVIFTMYFQIRSFKNGL